jgi:ethanolamine utilization protein EutN
MRAGKVIGRVWSTKKLEQLPPGALLRIELEAKAGTLVALDPLGCGENEQVLVVTGSVARDYLSGSAPVDAVVIASLDEIAAKPKSKSK